MNRFEQLDSFTFEIEAAINAADTRLQKCDDPEGGELIIEEFISLLNRHVSRYMIEFDLITYDIIGSLEMIKYDYAVSGTIAAEMLGAIEFVKMALVADTNIIFESEEEIDVDLEDLDDEEF